MTCDESYESHECILLIAFLIEEGHIFMTRAGHTVILSDQTLKNGPSLVKVIIEKSRSEGSLNGARHN